jgi:(R,R)-butanediol dehydrogenase / meso-butanediol dehydrogenase / diacetyl reductase
MKAAVFRGVEDVRVEDVDEPQPDASDVVVEVAACGICGSDLHTFQHGSFVEPGQVMGHEFSGRVVAVGSGVEGIAEGDRVTAVPIQPCNACARCAEGRYNLCGVAWTTAIAYGKPGAFAERVRVPNARLGRNVFKLPDGVDDESGATVEPLAVAVHAARIAQDVEGRTALVLGLGTIGQQVVQVLRARGARRVIGVDLSELRLDAARGFGADVLHGGEGLGPALSGALAEGEEVDLVFECSGVPAPARTASIALYDDPVTFNPTSLVQREVTLTGSIAYTHEDFAEAIDLLSSGQAVAAPLVTQREKLDDILAAFRVQLEKDRSLKVLVTPAGG